MKRRPFSFMPNSSDPRAYMVLALILLVICMIKPAHRRSRFGMSLMAIGKMSRPLSSSINPIRWKMLAMMIAPRWAQRPAASPPWCFLVHHATDHVYGALLRAGARIMALFGGVGVFWGPVIRRRSPGAARRDCRCEAPRQHSARHSGRRVRRCHYRHHARCAGRHLLAFARFFQRAEAPARQGTDFRVDRRDDRRRSEKLRRTQARGSRRGSAQSRPPEPRLRRPQGG